MSNILNPMYVETLTVVALEDVHARNASRTRKRRRFIFMRLHPLTLEYPPYIQHPEFSVFSQFLYFQVNRVEWWMVDNIQRGQSSSSSITEDHAASLITSKNSSYQSLCFHNSILNELAHTRDRRTQNTSSASLPPLVPEISSERPAASAAP
jgi:hypothetical protein